MKKILYTGVGHEIGGVELLVKQIVAKSKNGNAGIKGKIAPIAPNTTPIHPITINNPLFIFILIFLSTFNKMSQC